VTETTALNDDLCSNAEFAATKAEALSAFSAFKLQHVKRQLAIMLGLIGRDGIFDQYTRHDITHINELLRMLDWIIPDKTKSVMTAADWLLTVLSIYFHDFGMLVTKKEYESRTASPTFSAFKAARLATDDISKDFRAKLARLPAEESERFLYQEYVRGNHAARIRTWIDGRDAELYGNAKETAEAINGLMSTLPLAFRRDLGLVCESHHADDLSDLAKYSVSRPYGASQAATANVQYSAILLRTVDILHMTSDRTPSVAFQLISPTDPISQREWAKQGAVRSVRPQAARNVDGEVDPSASSDTVEVHALFQNPDGFFALTEFLKYVKSELKRSFDWSKLAQQREGASAYVFPWRDIDERYVEAQGFLSNRFQFSIDQNRVLDLLTGHTLYNDTRVVLRELLQNSIDAIRVHRLILGDLAAGRVEVRWDSAARTLEVQDDGTGMTQSIIESYLLRVGSSRYQDQAFKKEFPQFRPISRFGIGLLSCFMVADQVDIFTSHPDETDARHLSLRTVHGRYLVRLLSKTDTVEGRRLGPHGTIVRLTVRSSARLGDVKQIANMWAVVPPCDVLVSVDGEPLVTVGRANLKDALRDAMRADGLEVGEGREEGPGALRIEERTVNGVRVAFALRWSEWFKEWSFVQPANRPNEAAPLGTCVEGIRVEFGTPGYGDRRFYAIANSTGESGARTNVARTAFEAGPEYQQLLSHIYSAYAEHVRSEILAMVRERQYSLTGATREAGWLVAPLLNGLAAEAQQMIINVVGGLPLFLIEDRKGRRAASASELAESKHFWTLESELIRSAEKMIGEVATSGSLGALGRALGGSMFDLPEDPMLCGHGETHLRATLLAEWEVDRVVAKRTERRLDLRWSLRGGQSMWATPSLRTRLVGARHDVRRRNVLLDFRANKGIEIEGLVDEIAVKSQQGLFLRKGTELNQFLIEEIDRAEAGGEQDATELMVIVLQVQRLIAAQPTSRVAVDVIRRGFANEWGGELTPRMTEFCTIASDVVWRVFDPGVWVRKPSAINAVEEW
jgi:molecular chaperone HtpG